MGAQGPAGENALAVADAQAVEQAFERRLTDLSEAADAEAEPPSIQGQGGGELPGQSETLNASGGQPRSVQARSEESDGFGSAAREPLPPRAATGERCTSPQPPPGIDKSVLALSEPKRHRNKEHLRFVAQQACLICARTPSDPHHLRFAQPRALGRKVSDEFVVPVCRTHHRALHRVGNERAWWQAAKIDALKIARKLWKQSRHPTGEVGDVADVAVAGVETTPTAVPTTVEQPR
jgi:hypothetical protein